MSPEQKTHQLRLNKRQRTIVPILLGTNMEPFEVHELVADMADLDIALKSIYSVIDKLRRDELIEGWNGRVIDEKTRAYLYNINEQGHRALEDVRPTRTEVIIGKVASKLPTKK